MIKQGYFLILPVFMQVWGIEANKRSWIYNTQFSKYEVPYCGSYNYSIKLRQLHILETAFQSFPHTLRFKEIARFQTLTSCRTKTASTTRWASILVESSNHTVAWWSTNRIKLKQPLAASAVLDGTSGRNSNANAHWGNTDCNYVHVESKQPDLGKR